MTSPGKPEPGGAGVSARSRARVTGRLEGYSSLAWRGRLHPLAGTEARATGLEGEMIEHILVPLDGSELAGRALPWALAVARHAHARVTLLRAAGQLAADWLDSPEARREVEAEMDAYLAGQVERLQGQGIAADGVLRHDLPGPSIVDTVSREGIDLIVMSTHGRTGVGRWVFGSVADHVLRHTSAPVLLVPSAAEAAPPKGERLNVLVGLDGSELAEEILPTVAALAQVIPITLTLVRIVEPPNYALLGEGAAYAPYDTFDAGAESALAHRYLQEVAERLKAQGMEARIRIATGEAAQRILEAGQSEKVDLIAMATHGRGGLERLMLGSVAERLLHDARYPMLLVRAPVPRNAVPAALVRPEHSQ